MIRLDTFRQETGAQGLEATYHVLWTVKALAATSPETHWYLPRVTLAPTPGNPVSWGATIPTDSGAYIYTSFPPLGFLVPYAVATVLGGDISFSTLAFFNSILGLIASIGIGFLSRDAFNCVAECSSNKGNAGWIVFAASATSYLFTREALVSHGAVYWAHSLSQVTLIFITWVAFRIFQGQRSNTNTFALFLGCSIYASLEWTGFIFNAGLVVAFVVFPRIPHTAGYCAALVVVIATLAAGFALLAHFAIALGIDETLSALGERASRRAVTSGYSLGRLAVGYFVSFGALTPLGLTAFLYILSCGIFKKTRPLLALLFISSFPTLENMILMQHAAQFSFDRLKVALPLILLCVIAIASVPRSAFATLLAVYLVVSSNLQIFAHDKLYFASWGEAVSTNTEIVRALQNDPLYNCSLLSAKSGVRGYLNLAVGRDVFEYWSLERLMTEAREEQACGIVLIETTNLFVDLPLIDSIIVYDVNGRILRKFS